MALNIILDQENSRPSIRAKNYPNWKLTKANVIREYLLPLFLPRHPLFACLDSMSFFVIFEEVDWKNWKKPIWLNSYCDIQDYPGPQGAR